MATIKNNFVVNMAANSFYRYVEKVKEGFERTERQKKSLSDMAQESDRLAQSFSGAAAPIEQVSSATTSLVERLSGLENKLQNALTDKEVDRAIVNLQQGMERVGLVWTQTGDNIDKASTLAKNSLEQLASQGLIQASDAVEQLAQAEQNATQATEQHERKTNILTGALSGLTRGAKNAATSLLGFGKAKNPLDSVINRMTRMVVTLFSVRRVLRYVTDAMARAPDLIATSFDALKTNIQDTFARVVVSGLAGAQNGVDRLNAALNSPAGQRFFRGLEQAAQLAGAAVGWLMDKAGGVIEWLGEHSEQVFTTAAIAAAFFAAQLLAVNASALLATAPIVAIVAGIALLIKKLNDMGVTSETIFSSFVGGIFVIGAGIKNLVLLIAAIAHEIIGWAKLIGENISTAFINAILDAQAMFWGLAATAAKVVSKIAEYLNKLPFVSFDFSGITSAADAYAQKQSQLLGQKGTYNTGADFARVTQEARDKYNPFADGWATQAFNAGQTAGKDIFNKFSDFTLNNLFGQEIKPASDSTLKGIKGDTSALRKAVDMTEEDLKSFVDLAERRYVNQVNLTTLRPQIVVNGQNTGNTEADRYAVAEGLKEVLMELTASGSFVATEMP